MTEEVEADWSKFWSVIKHVRYRDGRKGFCLKYGKFNIVVKELLGALVTLLQLLTN